MSSQRSNNSTPAKDNAPQANGKKQRIDPEALVKMPLHERIKFLQTYSESSSDDGEPQNKGRKAPPGPSKSGSSGSAPQEQPQDGKASSGGVDSKAAAQHLKFNFTSTHEELSDGLAMVGDASKASNFRQPNVFNLAKKSSKDNTVNSDLARGAATSEGVDSSREGEVVAQHAVFGKVFAKKKTISRQSSDVKTAEGRLGIVPPVFQHAPLMVPNAVGSVSDKKKTALYESFDKRGVQSNSGRGLNQSTVQDSDANLNKRQNTKEIVVDQDSSTPRRREDLQEPITVSRVERSRAENQQLSKRSPNADDLDTSAAFGEHNNLLDQYEYKFGFDDIRWYQNDLIIDHLNEQVGSLIQNGPVIQNYLETHDPNSDYQSSIGSISSADEKDMHILFSGDHTYQFQAVQRVKKESSRAFDELEECKKELESKRSRLVCIRDYLVCKDAIRRQSEIEDLVKKLERKQAKFHSNFNRARERKGLQRLASMRSTSNGTSLRMNSKKFSEDVLGHENMAKSVPAYMLQQKGSVVSKQNDNRENNPLRGPMQKPDGGSLWRRATQRMKKGPPQSNRGPKNSARAHRDSAGAAGDREGANAAGRDLKADSAGEAEASDENKGSGEDEEKFADDHQEEREDAGGDLTGLGASGYFNQDEPEEPTKQMSKCRERCMRLKIDPEWKRVRQFQLVASVTFYADYFLTCFMIGNYRYDSDFLHHAQAFTVIVAVQAIDIALNFFTIRIVDAQVIEDPVELSLHYLRWQFWIDLIAVVPWPIFLPQYSFVRLIRMSKMSDYQANINDLIFSQFQGFLNNEQIKKVINGLDLFIMLAILSHIFANLWILIGLYGKLVNDEGWIKHFSSEDSGVIQNTDFSNLYITSIYWVIVTFSSVGYGDITGKTGGEMLYQTMVEMIGIGFFGYMIGVFQNLLSGFSQKDQNSEQQDRIDLWLVTLDRAKAHRYLSRSIFKQVKDFYREKLKFDTSYAFDTVFFEQLKPRLKRLILEHIFQAFDASFTHLFENCEFEFRAEIYRNAIFRMYDKDCEQENSDEESKDLWFTYEDPPVIERAGQMSKAFHMIIKGTVHIMDKSGIHEYATLGEGSYFGDISLMLGQPSEFSYYYDNHTSDPIHALSVDAQTFLDICKRFPLAERSFRQRAIKRNAMFRNFKQIALLKQMKAIVRTPAIVHSNHQACTPTAKGKGNLSSKKVKNASYEQQIELFGLFVEQYEIARQARKRRMQNKFKATGKSENNDGLEPNSGTNQKIQWNTAELKQAQYQAILIDRRIKLRNEVAMMRRASSIRPSMIKRGISLTKKPDVNSINQNWQVREASSDGSSSENKDKNNEGFKLQAVQQHADCDLHAELPSQIHNQPAADDQAHEGGAQEAPFTQRNPRLPADLTMNHAEHLMFTQGQRSQSMPSSRKEGGSSENSNGPNGQLRSQPVTTGMMAKPPKNPQAIGQAKVHDYKGQNAQESSEEDLPGANAQDFSDRRGSRNNGQLPRASLDALQAPAKASSGEDHRSGSAPFGGIGSNSEKIIVQNAQKKAIGHDIIGQNLSESSIKAGSLQNVKQSDSYKGVLLWDSNLREDQAHPPAKDYGKAVKVSEDDEEQQIEVGNVVEPPLNLSNQLQLNNTTGLEPQLDIVDEEKSRFRSEPATSPLGAHIPIAPVHASKIIVKDGEHSNDHSFGVKSMIGQRAQLEQQKGKEEAEKVDPQQPHENRVESYPVKHTGMATIHELKEGKERICCDINPVLAAKVDIAQVTESVETRVIDKDQLLNLNQGPKEKDKKSPRMTLRQQQLDFEKKLQVCDDLQELIDAGAYQDCDLDELDKKAEEVRQKIIKKLDKYFAYMTKERQKYVNRLIREKLIAAKRQSDGSKDLLQHLKQVGARQTPAALTREIPESHVDRIISEYLLAMKREAQKNKDQQEECADETPDGENYGKADDQAPRGRIRSHQMQKPKHFIAATNGAKKELSREARLMQANSQKYDQTLASTSVAKEAAEEYQKRQDQIKDECSFIRGQQDEEFNQLRQQVADTLLKQVNEFAIKFKDKIALIDSKLHGKINLKLDQVYENFDGMSDTDKEYFLRKSHELEVKRMILKKQQGEIKRISTIVVSSDQ